MRRRSLLAATAAWIAACASAPPPAAKRRGLTAADVFAVEPAALRAAVLTDARVMVQAVVIELRELGKQERFLLRLQNAAAADPGLPPAPSGSAWQVFALNTDGVTTLVTVRQLLLSRVGGSDDIAVSVSAQPAMVPADLLAALPVRIAMLVDGREGWFTLAEDTLDLRH